MAYPLSALTTADECPPHRPPDSGVLRRTPRRTTADTPDSAADYRGLRRTFVRRGQFRRIICIRRTPAGPGGLRRAPPRATPESAEASGYAGVRLAGTAVRRGSPAAFVRRAPPDSAGPRRTLPDPTGLRRTSSAGLRRVASAEQRPPDSVRRATSASRHMKSAGPAGPAWPAGPAASAEAAGPAGPADPPD